MPDQVLTYVLSGGVVNQDPDNALGGPPSSTIIDDITNNLFADVTGAQTNTGFVDYRCYYVFNDNDDDYVDMQIWIQSQEAQGSSCELGVVTRNEKQDLTFVNVSGGDFTLSVDGSVTDTISFTFDPDLMAAALQVGIRGLGNGAGCLVTSQGGNVYRVEFAGINANTAYPMMTIGTNALLPDQPLDPVGITFTRNQGGSPVNSVAPDTGSVQTPPTGISFSEPDNDSPIVIGTVRSGDGFPVWIKRTTDLETEAIQNDGITVKVKGDRVPGGL